MATVSNSSPLILFARINRFDLLRELFGQVLMPSAVWREVVTGATGRTGAHEVEQAAWIRLEPISGHERTLPLAALHAGEAEAITLATRLGPGTTLLLDDRRARRVASDSGMIVVGSAGLLVRAKDVGLLPAVQPVLLELVAAGLFLGDLAIREVLERSGELTNPASS